MNLAAVVETTIGLTCKTRIIPAIYLCCALVNLVGNVLVVPHLGMKGAAATTLLAYGLQTVLMYGYVRRFYPFVWNLPFIWRSIVGVGVMVSFLIVSREQDLPLVLAGLLLGVGGYAGTLVLLRGFEAREWGLLKNLLTVDRS